MSKFIDEEVSYSVGNDVNYLSYSENAEITDFIENKDDFYDLERSFIESIPWRTASLNSESIKDVLRNIFNNDNIDYKFDINSLSQVILNSYPSSLLVKESIILPSESVNVYCESTMVL